MKKGIEKGSVQHLIIQIISIIIAGLIIFPLCDFLFCKILQNTNFVYSVNDHIIEPIIFGVIAGLIFWTLDKKSVKKAQK